MRILFLNQYYVPDTAATGQLLADVAEELAFQGHDVHVICSRRPYSGGAVDVTPAQAGGVANGEMNGVQVHRVRATGFGRGRAVGRIADYLSFYVLATWRAFRLPKVDVCVALTTPPFIALVGTMLHRLRGTRLVLWSMDVFPEVAVALNALTEKGVLHRFLAWLSRRIYKSSSAIISLGDIMAERLAEAGAPPDRIAIVQNWVPRESVGQ